MFALPANRDAHPFCYWNDSRIVEFPVPVVKVHWRKTNEAECNAGDVRDCHLLFGR